MKKLKQILHRIRWIFYIGFFCLFLKGIGVYRSIVNDKTSPHYNPGHPVAFTKVDLSNMEILQFGKKVQMKTDSIVRVRKNQLNSGDKYTFADYAYDFAEIDIFIFKSGQDPDIYLSHKNNLVNFMYERIRKDDLKTDDESKIEAENIYSAKTGIFGRFSDYIDPEDNDKTEFSWSNLWDWLGRKYLKILPLSFLLYLFWFFTDGRASKYMKRNPLSFLISLLLYPLVMAILIQELFSQKARETLMGADYRRTKDEFFSALSKDEIARIKAFAKSKKKLFEWRQELKEEGRVFKHSFVLVLTFTIFLGFMFRSTSSSAENKTDKRSEIYQVVKEKTDSFFNVWDFLEADDGALPDIIPWPIFVSRKIQFINKIHILENGFIPDIGHIPNSISNFNPL